MGNIRTFSGEKVFESRKLVADYLVEDEFWKDLKSQLVLSWEGCTKDEKGNMLFTGQEKSFPPKEFEKAFEELAKNKDLVNLIRKAEK